MKTKKKYLKWLKVGRRIRQGATSDYKSACKMGTRLQALAISLRGKALRLWERMPWLQKIFRWLGGKLGWMRVLNPFRYIKRMDWYLIKKFIGTYIFSILLIISIAIVFDFNENLSKFTQYHAPWRAIIFDYYANFIP